MAKLNLKVVLVVVVVVAFVLTGFFIVSAREGDNVDIKNDGVVSVPPIDLGAPTSVETATFALG